jgi:hypothetical protein
MMNVTSRIGLLALAAIALCGSPGVAQDKCQACVNKETADCVRRVTSSPPAQSTPGRPAPVEASGASFCPQSAQNSCKASGACG